MEFVGEPFIKIIIDERLKYTSAMSTAWKNTTKNIVNAIDSIYL